MTDHETGTRAEQPAARLDRTTLVVGASWGLGRGIAWAFAEAGAPVVAVARTGPALAELAAARRASGPRSRTRPTRRPRGACWISTARRCSSSSPGPTR